LQEMEMELGSMQIQIEDFREIINSSQVQFSSYYPIIKWCEINYLFLKLVQLFSHISNLCRRRDWWNQTFPIASAIEGFSLLPRQGGEFQAFLIMSRQLKEFHFFVYLIWHTSWRCNSWVHVWQSVTKATLDCRTKSVIKIYTKSWDIIRKRVISQKCRKWTKCCENVSKMRKHTKS